MTNLRPHRERCQNKVLDQCPQPPHPCLRVGLMGRAGTNVPSPSPTIEFKWPSNSGVPSKIVRHCCSKSLCNRAPAPQEGPRALSRGLLLRVSLGLLWVLL